MRFHPDDSNSPPTARFQLYRDLIAALQRRVPGAPAKHFKDGIFTATGGAVWFEAERTTVDAGLVEGATPECRGPRRLLAYQRAQDRLLADAAADASLAGRFTLLKNDRDAAGAVYGAQENYEAAIADGWRLDVWRIGIVLLLIPALFAWLGLLLLIVATLVYFLVAQVVLRTIEATTGEAPSWEDRLIAARWRDGRAKPNAAPHWLESCLYVATHFATAPLTFGLLLLCKAVGFRRQRREMTAFFLSRAVTSGAGTLDRDERYWLADKAPAVDCLVGFGSLLSRRPLFNFGHFLKSLCIETPTAPREFAGLFSSRQRLQINLGDSNLCEEAEYLRIGTTMLVLDACEAGALPPSPQFSRPLRALRVWCGDDTLEAEVEDSEGRAWTAIGVQRHYWRACRRFVDGLDEAPAEADDLLARWADVLDRLESDRDSLVGRIDWATKAFLLREAGAGLPWAARKKIDLQYAELSPEGGWARLDAAGWARRVLTDDELERASRSAPPDSPATTRGRYIREFARSDEPLAVNWKQVVIGVGRRARVIRLAGYGRTDAKADGGRDA